MSIYAIEYVKLVYNINRRKDEYKTEIILIFPFLAISIHTTRVEIRTESNCAFRLCGSPPFFAPNRPQLFERIRRIDYCFHSPGKPNHNSTSIRKTIPQYILLSIRIIIIFIAGLLVKANL